MRALAVLLRTEPHRAEACAFPMRQASGDGGDGLINEDHPGFTDAVYMKRRAELAALADTYEYGKRLPHIGTPPVRGSLPAACARGTHHAVVRQITRTLKSGRGERCMIN